MYVIIPVIWYSLATFILKKRVALAAPARVALAIGIIVLCIFTTYFIGAYIAAAGEQSRVLSALLSIAALVGIPTIHTLIISYLIKTHAAAKTAR